MEGIQSSLFHKINLKNYFELLHSLEYLIFFGRTFFITALFVVLHSIWFAIKIQKSGQTKIHRWEFLIGLWMKPSPVFVIFLVGRTLRGYRVRGLIEKTFKLRNVERIEQRCGLVGIFVDVTYSIAK